MIAIRAIVRIRLRLIRYAGQLTTSCNCQMSGSWGENPAPEEKFCTLLERLEKFRAKGDIPFRFPSTALADVIVNNKYICNM